MTLKQLLLALTLASRVKVFVGPFLIADDTSACVLRSDNSTIVSRFDRLVDRLEVFNNTLYISFDF